MRYNPDEWKKRIEAVIAAGPYTDTWESLSEHETPRRLCGEKALSQGHLLTGLSTGGS